MDISALKSDYSRLRDLWGTGGGSGSGPGPASASTFRSARYDWDLLRHRRKPVVLEPHLQKWAQVQFRSPDLEFFGGQYVQERMLRPTRIDAIPFSTKQGVIEDIRDCRTWYACEWDYQNRGRRLDRARSQGQVYYGLAVERTYWEMPGEPDDVDTEEEDEGPEKVLQKRDRAIMEQEIHPFRIEPIHPMTVMFAPIHDPKVFIEEGVMSLYQLRKLKSPKGDQYDMSEKGMINIRGDKEPLQPWNDRALQGDAQVYFITRAIEDEETEEWTIAEYICPRNGSSPDYDKAIEYDEQVVPFGRCPYEVIPSGEYDLLATDPHLAFRPRMFPLYVDINDLNQIETKIMAYAVRNTNSVAVTLQGANSEALWAWLEGQYGAAEGSGSERGMVLPISDNGPGEWPVVPQLIRIPFELDTALMTQRQGILDRIKEHQPNRFQTGNLGKTEATEMKATTNANAWEASALPIEHDLTMQDAATVRHMENWDRAILYWPEDKKYPFTVSGEEPMGSIGGQAWASRKIGESGFVNAKMIGQKHRIIAKTRNTTLAEEQIEQLMAAQDEANGIISHDQHLERRGVDDVQKQKELLEADQQEKDDAPHVRQLLQQTRLAIFTFRTGANKAALMGLPPPMPSGLPEPPTYPGPVEASPSRSGTGPPQYKPPFMAEGQRGVAETNPQNVPHGVQPSPMGVGQGSSPSGGGMPGT